jgi:hypothetical protein
MNRMHTYPTTKEAKRKELNIIQDTLRTSNSEYNKNFSMRDSKQHKHNKISGLQHERKQNGLFLYI